MPEQGKHWHCVEKASGIMEAFISLLKAFITGERATRSN